MVIRVTKYIAPSRPTRYFPHPHKHLIGRQNEMFSIEASHHLGPQRAPSFLSHTPRPEICFRIMHKHPLGCKDETFAILIVLHAAKTIPTRSPSHSIGPISAVRKSYPSRSRPRAYPHPSAQASHGPTACNLLSQIALPRPTD